MTPAGPVAIITEADLLRAVAHGADIGQALTTDWTNRNPLPSARTRR
jgi:hypothetical protein